MKLVDIRVVLKHIGKLGLGKEMQLTARHLLLDAPHYGRGQHDVADGAEPNDEYLLHV
jgi:hypothetical protein